MDISAIIFLNIVVITPLVTTTLKKGAMECNLSESIGAQQCFGVLGKSFIFYPIITGTNTQAVLKKDDVTILKFTHHTGTIYGESYKARSSFFTNGSFKLEKVSKNDSGCYVLDKHDHITGRFLNGINIRLAIQAPVSEPVVSQVCLSPEQMNISCSSEGDEVEFTLTLDGQSLIQTRAGSTDEQHELKVSISLYGNITGTFTCDVHNNISRSKTFIHLTNCNGSQPGLIVVIVVSVACLLLLLASFLGIKRLNKKTGTQTPTTVNDDIAEDQIVYSEVQVIERGRDTRDTCYDYTEDETFYADVRVTKLATENRHNWHQNAS